MATVVWHMPPEYGHLAPATPLARSLVAAGHRVVMLSELDMADHIAQAGFEYLPYLAQVYPAGSLAARDLLGADETWEWWLGRDLAMWQEVSSGRLEAQLAPLAPALIVGDQLNPDTSLLAHKLQTPFVRVSAMVPSYHEADVPPIWSDALPGELSPRQIEIEWMCHDALFWRKPWIDRDNPIERSAFYRFVEQCGLDVAQINYRGAFNWHVESDPEVVLCSKAFDFPRPDLPGRVYIGPCLSELAGEPWSYPARRAGAPLIYCAFGSKGASYPTARRVIECLLATARARPQLDIVLAVPDEVVRDYAIPPTVHTLRWAPQRAVLAVADLFITHAGINSCREAIWDGVPMLAVPQAHDQRGDAARIVYHGLGERLLGATPSSEAFTAAIDRLLGDPRYRQAAARMREQFRADAKDDVGLRFVTAVMERRIALAPATDYADIRRRLYGSIMGED